MALPNFAGVGFGLLLTRVNNVTGVETILTWLNPGADQVVDTPGPGYFTYKVYMIDGVGTSASTAPSPLVCSGRQTISVTNLKR